MDILFVVVVLVAGSFCIQTSSGGCVCPLVYFYGLLHISYVLSISVIAESELLCPVVLILSSVARAAV